MLMNLQQIIGLFIVAVFIVRLIQQYRNRRVSGSEFLLWMILWLAAGAAILSLKWLDFIAKEAGFSASGINILLYISVVVLLYFVFRLRLRLAKLENDITKIVQVVATKEK